MNRWTSEEWKHFPLRISNNSTYLYSSYGGCTYDLIVVVFAFLTSRLCHDSANVGPTDTHLDLIAAKFFLQGQRRVNTLPFRLERGGI